MQHDPPGSSRHARRSEVDELPQSTPKNHGARLTSIHWRRWATASMVARVPSSSTSALKRFRFMGLRKATIRAALSGPFYRIYLLGSCTNSGGAGGTADLGTEVGLKPAPTSLSRHADQVGEGIGGVGVMVRDDLGLGARPRKVISAPIDASRHKVTSGFPMYASRVSFLAFEG